MLKYVDTEITFAEVPREISLCVSISNCPNHCPDCHSKYLWDDVGHELTDAVVDMLLRKFSDATCFCIMGGDNDKERVFQILKYVKSKGIKTAWYSGQTEIPSDISFFDYIKIGPFIKEYGGLRSKTTNQKMYKVENGNLTEITLYKLL